MNGDASHPSHSEFNLFQDGNEDRIRALEKRVEMQDDEIALLKSSMADILRRLNETELNSVRKPLAVKSHFRALPSRPNVDGTPPRNRGNMVAPSPRRRTSSSSRNSASENHNGKTNGFSPVALKRSGSSDHIPRDQTRASFGKGSRQRSRPPTPSGQKETSYNSSEGTVRMYLKGRPVVLYRPSEMDYQTPSSPQLPDNKLKLEWVYGYRGKDCRSNVFFLPTGEIVYFVAAVVVLYNPNEGLQRHYLEHNDDVKCMALHPDKLKIATGQMAGIELDGKPRHPHVRVWDAVNLNTLHVIGMEVFDRSVTCLAFSKSDNGKYLSVIDESNDHVMSIWEWEKEKKIIDVKTSKDTVVACEFNSQEDGQLVTCGKNHIAFWTWADDKLTKKQGLFEKHDKPKYILCIAFTSEGAVISGDSYGNIQIWSKGKSKTIDKFLDGAHDGAVFSLCLLRDGSFVSGGGKDGRLVVWDTDFKPSQGIQIPEEDGGIRTITSGSGDSLFIGTKKNAILTGSAEGGFDTVVKSHVDELWGLSVHPSGSRFVTGAHDKRLIMWDSATHKPLWMKTLEDPIQSVDFHPDGNVIAVGMATGRWVVLDLNTLEFITVHTDGNEQHDVVRYSPDGNLLAVGSHDNNIYIYAISDEGKRYSKQGKCSGHSSYITHLDWSIDNNHIQSNSGDYEILYWDVKTCKQITGASTLRDTEWATQTCTLGFNVIGIWPEGADGTDVNSACRSHDNSILATGDDFGKVHLYKYPACYPKAQSISHSGHSSHVTSVQFLKDGGKLISTGGNDCSVMQWTVV